MAAVVALDAGLTVFQNRSYFSGSAKAVNETAPHGAWLLQRGPGTFAAAASVYLLALFCALKIVAHRNRLILFFSVTIAHAIPGFRRFESFVMELMEAHHLRLSSLGVWLIEVLPTVFFACLCAAAAHAYFAAQENPP